MAARNQLPPRNTPGVHNTGIPYVPGQEYWPGTAYLNQISQPTVNTSRFVGQGDPILPDNPDDPSGLVASRQRQAPDAGMSYLPNYVRGTPSLNTGSMAPSAGANSFTSGYLSGRQPTAFNTQSRAPYSPPDAGMSYIPKFAAGGTPTLNPGPSAGWGQSGAGAGLAEADPLASLAEQLAAMVGAYPGAVPINMPERVHFDRWQRDQDLSGIFDPIQQEYQPVLETLYNNLQGSLGNIRSNLDQGWQDTKGSLEGQWAGVNEDQQTAFAERDAELRNLATQLGVPESAMMTDPALERWGRENERLKQLNATLQTSQMGSMDTLAQAQSSGLGAYGPALEAAKGMSIGEMAMTLAQQKGGLGSDLLNLESQHETQMAQGEQDLYRQMFDAAMQNSDREYNRLTKGWEMRAKAAQDAAEALSDSQKASADEEKWKAMMEAINTTETENSEQWLPVWQALEKTPKSTRSGSNLMDTFQNRVMSEGGVNPALKRIMASPEKVIPKTETGTDYVARNTPLFSGKGGGRVTPMGEDLLDRALALMLKKGGIFPAAYAGQLGLPGQKSVTRDQTTQKS